MTLMKMTILLVQPIILFLLTISLYEYFPKAYGIRAGSKGFSYPQPDGTWTPTLYLSGNEQFHYYRDDNNFTIIRDNQGWYCYANLSIVEHEIESLPRINRLKKNGVKIDESCIRRRDKQKALFVSLLHSTGIKIRENTTEVASETLKRGIVLPKAGTVNRYIQNICINLIDEGYNRDYGPISSKPLESQRTRFLTSEKNESLKNELNNLVIPIIFSDHIDRNLPTKEQLFILFNSEGGHKEFAPTGSVKDVFLQNSYGKLTLNSTILDWVTLKGSQEYYADKSSGMTPKLIEAMHEALDNLEQHGFDFGPYDMDGDRRLDSITFLHSGYVAEYGGIDCIDQSLPSDRIWSHQWNMPNALHWKGKLSGKVHSNNITEKDTIVVDSYVISGSLWGYCDSGIARVGLLAHELSHQLGVPDLYETNGNEGAGLGIFDLMSSTWGANGDQYYPPLMSPWTKIELGWTKPTLIDYSGIFTLEASAISPKIFKITAGFPKGEYLLIENRQPLSFDSLIPQGGLAIYHIDESSPLQKHNGYPGQDGWPVNGKHYQVALVQADGFYNLERGDNHGDSGDLWHSSSPLKTLGPSISNPDAMTKATYPNSDSYRYGNITLTGVIIRNVSKSGLIMTFEVFSPLFEKHNQSTSLMSPTSSPTITVPGPTLRSPTSQHFQYKNQSLSTPSIQPSIDNSNITKPHNLNVSQTLSQEQLTNINGNDEVENIFSIHEDDKSESFETLEDHKKDKYVVQARKKISFSDTGTTKVSFLSMNCEGSAFLTFFTVVLLEIM